MSLGSAGDVSMGGMPYHQLIPSTCPDLSRLLKIVR